VPINGVRATERTASAGVTRMRRLAVGRYVRRRQHIRLSRLRSAALRTRPARCAPDTLSTSRATQRAPVCRRRGKRQGHLQLRGIDADCLNGGFRAKPPSSYCLSLAWPCAAREVDVARESAANLHLYELRDQNTATPRLLILALVPIVSHSA